jgi:antitoxin VapB
MPVVSEKTAAYIAEVPPRQVRLFRNGANQAVRIPREFEFDAQEVTMRRVGKALLLEPLQTRPQRGTAAALAAALLSMKDWPVVDEPFPDFDDGLAPLNEVEL